jgi:predicted outer membrane repeat protein
MWNESFSVLDMENVSFIGNSAESGGAIFNDESTTRITNSIFFANSATDLGGAIVNSFGSTVILTNVTFNENTGINPGVSVYNSFSHLSIRNSILWDIQQAPIFDDHSFSLNVSFSDVYGGFAGPGNINADPYLGMPGLFGGFTETIPLSESGPVIDGVPVTECKKPDGSPLTIDQRGVSRPQAFGCDMGAFEVVDTQGIWIANTGLQVKTNMPVVITRDYLRLDDGNSAPEKLVYTISHLPAFGRLRLNGQDLKVADSFTQADVDARKLMYLNDGDSGPDGFGFLYSGPGYLAIERVSVGSGGIQVNAASWNAQMSGDGQYVVFESKAQNIVSQDTDGQDLIYLRDRWADQTCMVSAAEDGTAAQRVSGEVCKWDTV